MARTTTNYGFNISEGTDLVNPLTDIFPNFESLDTDLKEVSDATFGVATELKTGTVHALTRDDKDKTVFKFTATANFTAGDTFTLDGAQVSALTTAGEQLTTGCYIIGSEVIVAVKGTLLTFFISNVVTDASTLEGHNASYFATASDLSDTDADVLAVSNKVGSAVLTTTAQDCSSAINELNTDLSELMNIEVTQTETLIGKFGNDDLYRRVYTLTNVPVVYGTGTTIDASFNVAYVKNLVRLYGSGKMNYGTILPLNGPTVQVAIDGSTLGLNVSFAVSGGSYTIEKGVLIVEYTKN